MIATSPSARQRPPRLARLLLVLAASLLVVVGCWRPADGVAAPGLAFPDGRMATAFVAPPPPAVSAQAVYVLDATAGTELYALNPDEPRPPASLTKIATALVVLANADLGDRVTIESTDLADPSESQVGLEVGDTLNVEDLLYGLLVPSGNDAARALARHVGATLPGGDTRAGDGASAAFIAELNALVASLGLRQTHFTNVSGLDDPEHYASARDLALLAERAMEDRTFATIVATPIAVLASELRPDGYEVKTTNDLLLDGTVQGGKTGTTGEAGGCLMTIAPFGSNRVITIVLGSPTVPDPETGGLKSPARFDDARMILAAIPNDYRWLDPTVPGQVAGLAEELSVWETALRPGAAIVVPAARAEDLRYRLQLGPSAKPNAEVGKVLFFVGSELLSERPVFQAGRGGVAEWAPAVAGRMSASMSAP